MAVVAVATLGAAQAGTGGSPETATAPPVVKNTRLNLQSAFNGEVNAKENYLAAAQVADREGYAYVARLFRACARAEQVHADQHVHAIAAAGDEAKAFLERPSLDTTAANLRSAIALETYEATELYPAYLARAREERMSQAVRSMNFALATEREHALLLTAALETLDQRPAPRPFHVCAQCGKTVESVDFKVCPNCFGPARGFERVD